MTVFDYAVLGATVVLFVLGCIKGLLKPLFSIIGVIFITSFGAVLTPFLQDWEWLAGVISDAELLSKVCVIVSYVILALAYIIVSNLIIKAINKKKTLGAANRLLGGLLNVLIVYLVLSVVFVLVVGTDTIQQPLFAKLNELYGEDLQNTWLYNNIFQGDKNFFGNMIMKAITEKLNSLTAAA